MSRSQAAFTTLIREKLQQSGTVAFSVAEINDQIDESLKEYGTYVPHIVPMIFKVESRFGVASTTSASNLVDTAKGQFLTTDDDDEKVVHNKTDNTWAVISSVSSTAQVGLTGDIFVSGEYYDIYNKQCWNKRQIYLGDVPENYQVATVEYPIGQRRNFARLENDVLELAVDYVPDSDAGTTITNLPNVDVLVRFEKPHILSRLTDWTGKMAATAAISATSISSTAWQGAGTIDVGSEFTIQYHKSTYIVAASATIASSAATIVFYPPLERAVASTTQIINMRMTTLKPEHEEIFADLVAARLTINKSPKFFNITTTGTGVAGQHLDWGERRLAETLMKLNRTVPPKTKTRWSSG